MINRRKHILDSDTAPPPRAPRVKNGKRLQFWGWWGWACGGWRMEGGTDRWWEDPSHLRNGDADGVVRGNWLIGERGDDASKTRPELRVVHWGTAASCSSPSSPCMMTDAEIAQFLHRRNKSRWVSEVIVLFFLYQLWESTFYIFIFNYISLLGDNSYCTHTITMNI